MIEIGVAKFVSVITEIIAIIVIAPSLVMEFAAYIAIIASHNDFKNHFKPITTFKLNSELAARWCIKVNDT